MAVRSDNAQWLLKLTEIRWYNLREWQLQIEKCTLPSFVAFGMRSEGIVPKNGKSAVGFSLKKMLQHTGRFWSGIS